MPNVPVSGGTASLRLRVEVTGFVQGVGFRPYVYRLATSEGLSGWVRNTADGVRIEVEGANGPVQRFLRRLPEEAPPLARVESVRSAALDPADGAGFRVLTSGVARSGRAFVLPDVATCGECRREILDPADRRYLYPFTNCTNCGPRYSVILSLPYDRSRTTMRRFRMCEPCQAEYDDPASRRFHAQPNACADCGPRLELRSRHGARLARGPEALREAVAALAEGRIVALKGLGGFQLLADAGGLDAVRELRRRKLRSEKPFAVMAETIEAVRRIACVRPEEEELLLSPAAPIVLLDRAPGSDRDVCAGIAPGNPTMGVMIATTPLHVLILRELGHPLVATSGNLADEPLVYDEDHAIQRLGSVADLFLVHDRPIARPVDDSVVRFVAGRPLFLRVARGYAPLVLEDLGVPGPALAVGGHQKSTVAVARPGLAVLSQHLGDLDSPQAQDNFRAATPKLGELYGVEPESFACDLHPDYGSSRFVEDRRPLRVQHHHAHVLACLADNGLDGPALGVAFDGTGLGPDGTIWGGEFLEVQGADFRRFASLRPFPLPGGDRAAREPWRSALGVLWELGGARSPFGDGAARAQDLLPAFAALRDDERALLARALSRGFRCPVTTSAGRLFDAVAALLGLRDVASFEGQAAIELELAAREAEAAFGVANAPGMSMASAAHESPRRPAAGQPLRLELVRRWEAKAAPWPGRSPVAAPAPALEPVLRLDWGPLVEGLVRERERGESVAALASRFHDSLVGGIVDVARAAGQDLVALTGGCFQNAVLTERAADALAAAGFEVVRHRRLPPNDGSLAVGQLAALAHANRAGHGPPRNRSL